MKALVLVGGLGTRLRPLTYSVPKQLIPLAGKPMLYHALDLLPAQVEEVVLAAGYRASQVETYVRAHPWRRPVRTVAEAEPLGTGGGMKNAGGSMSDPFLLVNSDVVAEVDVPKMVEFHRKTRAYGTMLLCAVEDTRPYGVAALGAGDRIERFVEKPEPEDAPSHWINAGLAIWSREVLDRIPAGKPVGFEREVIPGLLARGVFGFCSKGFWEDAGTPERLLRAQRLLFDAGRGGRGRLPAGASGSGPIALVGEAFAKGASFGPYVTLGEGVTLGTGVHIENSVVMDGATIGKDARVEGSIIGPRVVVPHGDRITGQVRAVEPQG